MSNTADRDVPSLPRAAHEMRRSPGSPRASPVPLPMMATGEMLQQMAPEQLRQHVLALQQYIAHVHSHSGETSLALSHTCGLPFASRANTSTSSSGVVVKTPSSVGTSFRVANLRHRRVSSQGLSPPVNGGTTPARWDQSEDTHASGHSSVPAAVHGAPSAVMSASSGKRYRATPLDASVDFIQYLSPEESSQTGDESSEDARRMLPLARSSDGQGLQHTTVPFLAANRHESAPSGLAPASASVSAFLTLHNQVPAPHPGVIQSPMGSVRDPDSGMTSSAGNLPAASASSYLGVPAARVTQTLVRYRDESGRKLINHYLLLKELGRGSCGKVKLARDTFENRLVAIKQVRRAVDRSSGLLGRGLGAAKQYHSLQREIAVMKKLRHKSIVALFEVIDDPAVNKLYIVMQYIDRGPLAKLRMSSATEKVCEPIPRRELRAYARQILAGLEYLHRHGIVHRDVKPENVLVDHAQRVYLADFGMSEALERCGGTGREQREQTMPTSVREGMLVRGVKGTLLFLAPELLESGASHGKAVDMWATGVTFFALLTGRLPFRTVDDILNPQLPAIPTEYGEGWTTLLSGLLERNPCKRLTAHESRQILKCMGTIADSDKIDVTEEEIANAITYPMTVVEVPPLVGSCHSPISTAGTESHQPSVDFGLSEVVATRVGTPAAKNIGEAPGTPPSPAPAATSSDTPAGAGMDISHEPASLSPFCFLGGSRCAPGAPFAPQESLSRPANSGREWSATSDHRTRLSVSSLGHEGNHLVASGPGGRAAWANFANFTYDDGRRWLPKRPNTRGSVSFSSVLFPRLSEQTSNSSGAARLVDSRSGLASCQGPLTGDTSSPSIRTSSGGAASLDGMGTSTPWRCGSDDTSTDSLRDETKISDDRRRGSLKWKKERSKWRLSDGRGPARQTGKHDRTWGQDRFSGTLYSKKGGSTGSGARFKYLSTPNSLKLGSRRSREVTSTLFYSPTANSHDVAISTLNDVVLPIELKRPAQDQSEESCMSTFQLVASQTDQSLSTPRKAFDTPSPIQTSPILPSSTTVSATIESPLQLLPIQPLCTKPLPISVSPIPLDAAQSTNGPSVSSIGELNESDRCMVSLPLPHLTANVSDVSLPLSSTVSANETLPSAWTAQLALGENGTAVIKKGTPSGCGAAHKTTPFASASGQRDLRSIVPGGVTGEGFTDPLPNSASVPFRFAVQRASYHTPQ